MIERLKALKNTREQFAKGSELFSACKSNESLKQEISALSKRYLNRSVAGCQNCYMDAYLELINLSIDKVMSKDKIEFRLRNGALLRDVVNQSIDLNCTNLNITEELALYHLKTNPGCRKMFDKLPDNIEQLLEDFRLPGEGDNLDSESDELNDENSDKDEYGDDKETNDSPEDVNTNDAGEGDNLDSESDEQKQAAIELETTAKIVEMFKAGKTANEVKAEFNGIEVIGNKQLTNELLYSLIKAAKKVIKETKA
jgi:hypothetical protein